MPRKNAGMDLGMMGGESQSGLTTISKMQAARKDETDPRNKVRRGLVKLDSIVEFADMQTRRSFDPEKNPSDKTFVESIKRNGIILPVAIQPIEHNRSGKYRIIHGHRRFAAAEHLGLESIPADIWAIDVPEKVIDEVTIEENTQREDLTPLELARMIQKYMDKHGVTQKEAGALCGQSKAQTSKLLSLLKLPQEFMEFIEEYQVTANKAYRLSQLSEEEMKLSMDAIRKDLPHEAALSSVNPDAAKIERSAKKPVGTGSKRAETIENGYKMLRPKALTPMKNDLSGTKLKDLSDHEVIVLALVKQEDEEAWNNMLEEVRRLPKPVVRDTRKAVDQIFKVYAYSEYLNKDQVRILLKAIKIAVEKLLKVVSA